MLQFLHGFVHVFAVGFGQFFIFFLTARHQLDTWTLAPQKTVVWRDAVGVESSRSGLKIRVRGYFSSEWLLRHTDESPKGRNSCLGYNPALFLSSFGVVLMIFT